MNKILILLTVLSVSAVYASSPSTATDSNGISLSDGVKGTNNSGNNPGNLQYNHSNPTGNSGNDSSLGNSSY